MRPFVFFVYAIYNKKHGKVYIGQTENLGERMRLHNDGRFSGSYTARFDGEWQVIYYEAQQSRKEALVREKQLKSFRGREFIKSFIPE